MIYTIDHVYLHKLLQTSYRFYRKSAAAEQPTFLYRCSTVHCKLQLEAVKRLGSNSQLCLLGHLIIFLFFFSFFFKMKLLCTLCS